ncbi:MAG TPA: hypothetical protein VGH02_11675 [Rhizomicrobium sp.]|jgi:hypothetical protein
MRILIAALLGAIAMFIWMAIAHTVTPLGTTGFSQIPNEGPVMSAMQTAMGDHAGLYFYPWVDPKDPKMSEQMVAAEKAGPHGLLVYNPAGQNLDADMMPMLVKEFAKQFVQALIAAWIASMIMGGFTTRWLAVTGMFVSSAIAVNVSYWNWYHFPLDFTLAAIIMEVVSGIVAGAAIAWWLGRGTA